MSPHAIGVNARPLNDIDRYLRVRNRLVVGLVLSWIAGTTALITGSICLHIELVKGEAPRFRLSHALREIIPLIISILVTVMNESMAAIHAVTLKWSLHYENRMIWHSSLRLLTSSRTLGANKWYSNLFFFIFVVLSYVTPSMIFLGWTPRLAGALYIDYVGLEQEAANDTVHVSGVALLIFGVALLGQAIITTWGLNTCAIPTWSSFPLDIVYAVSDEYNVYRLVRRADRCMMSVHDIKRDSYPTFPKKIQGPLLTAHPEAKWILFSSWLLVFFAGLWGGIIYLMISRGNQNGILGTSWTFLPSFTGTAISPCHAASCTDGTSVLNIGWTSRSGPKGMVGTVFLVGCFQSAITLGLHCTELLVDVDQDEQLVRESTSEKGTRRIYSNMTAVFTNWKKFTLNAFKAVIHWMFGLALTVGYLLGVNMYPAQIFYLAIALFLFATFATIVTLLRPRGPLPASFGHLQTIADLFDDWNDRMFWGHKSLGINDQPSYTGTSHVRLKMPHYDVKYGGRAPNIDYIEASEGARREWMGHGEDDFERLIKPPGTVNRSGYMELELNELSRSSIGTTDLEDRLDSSRMLPNRLAPNG